jgi:hypothetical protein
MSERVLTFQGGPTEDGTVRPTISIYFDHDGWSNEQFADALRAGATDKIERESRRPLTMGAIHVVANVDGWEIGRKIVNAKGVLRLTRPRIWRRIGDGEWHSECDDGDKPSRAQVRRGAIEPYLELVSAMLGEARSLYPDWSEQMSVWRLTRVSDSRGQTRVVDSAVLAVGETDDYISRDLGVELQTVRKRRWRDRRAQLGQPPWAIRPETSVERCRIRAERLAVKTRRGEAP